MSQIKAGTTSATAITQTGDTTGVMEVLGSGGFGLKVGTDGKVYGDKLHNIGTVTGTTNQYIASGTYTPTITNGTNVAASTAYQCQWIRVGNVVVVSGRIDIDATAAASNTNLTISLPIASDIALATNIGGSGIGDVGEPMQIYGEPTTDTAQFSNTNWPTASNVSVFFTFQYIVL